MSQYTSTNMGCIRVISWGVFILVLFSIFFIGASLKNNYRIYSIKRPGAYLIFRLSGWALITFSPFSVSNLKWNFVFEVPLSEIGSLKSTLWGWCGRRLFEAGRLLTFSTFRVGAYSRWVLIQGWALKRINTVFYSRLLDMR